MEPRRPRQEIKKASDVFPSLRKYKRSSGNPSETTEVMRKSIVHRQPNQVMAEQESKTIDDMKVLFNSYSYTDDEIGFK